MGETSFHRSLVVYLAQVLRWLFHERACTIYENLNFYQTPDRYEYPLAPDIAVTKGVIFQHVRSWRVDQSGPAPHVVFEIASEETWGKDLREKPLKYAQMGVQEYFAYDPNVPALSRSRFRRLFGWQLDPGQQKMIEMPVGPGGRLWSPQLESWLVPAREYLRLYDSSGQICLTEAESEAAVRRAETRRAEAEAKRAETEARKVKVLAEKLRSLGIDPDHL